MEIMFKTHPDSRLLSRADVAEMFGVSPSTVTRWADAGLIPTAKTLGGHRRYDATAVSELAKQFQKEKPTMEELVFGVPAMWADHHVLAVRNALFALAGVDNVEASSAFKTVRVFFDPGRTSAQVVVKALVAAGYPPSGFEENGASPVPVSAGKTDPAWTALAMRTIQTHPADMAMSGEFRKY
jgi:excisionase family DNA binding protein